MSYADKTITCVDCGTEFVFTAREQEFYASRGLTNEPRRCADCRRARKSSREGGGGGGSYSSSAGAYSSGEPRQMYPATCARCGQETQVPFQPRGTRPVYCRDCYREMNPAGSRGGGH